MKSTNRVLASTVQEGPGTETEEAGPEPKGEVFGLVCVQRMVLFPSIWTVERAEPTTVLATLKNHGLPRGLNAPPFLNFG